MAMLWVCEMGGIYSVVHGGVHPCRDMTVRYAELLPPPPLVIETKARAAGGLATVAVVAGRPPAELLSCLVTHQIQSSNYSAVRRKDCASHAAAAILPVANLSEIKMSRPAPFRRLYGRSMVVAACSSRSSRCAKGLLV